MEVRIASTYLECEVKSLLTVSFIVETFLQPQGAALLLLVTDHVELLLLVSSHNTEGQLGVFSNVSVLCSQLQDLTTSNIVQENYVECVCVCVCVCVCECVCE